MRDFIDFRHFVQLKWCNSILRFFQSDHNLIAQQSVASVHIFPVPSARMHVIDPNAGDVDSEILIPLTVFEVQETTDRWKHSSA